MNAERWEHIKATFHTALEREPSELAAFLNQACAGDAALRAEVESLLAAHQDAGDFIDVTSLEMPDDLPAESKIESMAGRRIGQYMINREIAHGGMGTVYLAARADDQYQEQVAIKLIRGGAESGFITRRFRSERQILANLNHPNIARLLDGGATEDGLPYFVMEYIDGRPITEYCDANNLPVSDRLKLFRAVCSAVHYAHQNLIVHRDVKPGNILVTAEGTPKLLDFGIAKLLGPELSYQAEAATLTAMRVMTPDYASPEQIRGEPITTASDIYSLGVLLYELLTGHRPYHLKNRLPHEIAQAICEEEPEKPSTAVTRVEEASSGDSVIKLTPEMVSGTRDAEPVELRRRLSGDLDNIVLMAMRKEPSRRYASAEQLSEDIRRHLDGLPVIARKDTFAYRGGKFVKRHRAGVAAAALVVVTLFAGIVATTREAHIARGQRAKAERRFNDVREIANSLMFELHDAIEKLPGATPARAMLVKQSLKYLDRLAQESDDAPTLQRELAAAYVKVGDVQGRPYQGNLGDTEGALDSYQKATAIRERIVASNPGDSQARSDLATSYLRVGEAFIQTGRLEESLKNFRKALVIDKELYDQSPADTQIGRDLSLAFIRIGDALAMTGHPDEAIENQREALAIDEALAAANSSDSQTRLNLVIDNARVGDSLAAIGNTEGALESHFKARAIAEELWRLDPTNAKSRRYVAVVYTKIGEVFKKSGNTAGALESYRQSTAISEALATADPANAQARGDLAVDYKTVADMLVKMGKLPDALDYYGKSLAIIERLSASDPANAEYRSFITIPCAGLGDVHAALALGNSTPAGKRAAHWIEARKWYQRSLDILLDMRNHGTLNSEYDGDPEKITAKVARCDAALKGLQPASDRR